jgi:hypothetical protein
MMSIQLTKTAAAFELWRNDKPSKGAKIPTSLRQQAVALLPNHSRSTVTKSLRISGSQLNNWRFGNKNSAPAASFIQLPMSHELSPAKSLTVDLRMANGNQCSLAGELTIEHIMQLVEAIKS